MRRPLPTPQNLEGLLKAIESVRQRTENYATRYREQERSSVALDEAHSNLWNARVNVKAELEGRSMREDF